MNYFSKVLVFSGTIAMTSSILAENKTDDIQGKLDALTTGKNAYRGVAAVTISKDKIRYLKSGKDSINSTSIVDIASNTKIFTSLLFAIAYERGDLSLSDAVNTTWGKDLLPDAINDSIKLTDLSRHNAGFPKLPDNLPSQDPLQPYKGYTLELLEAFLGTTEFKKNERTDCKLAHEIDPKDYSDYIGKDIRSDRECFAYSNLGPMILGHAVASSLSTSYSLAIKKYISKPLGLSDTAFKLNDAQKKRKIQGYDTDGKVVAGWERNASDPSGGLFSSLQNMSVLMKHFIKLDKGDSVLDEAMKSTLEEISELKTGTKKIELGLGWFVFKNQDKKKIYWHNGGSDGFLSLMAIEPKSQKAVFIVGNSLKFIDGQVDNRIDVTGFSILKDLK